MKVAEMVTVRKNSAVLTVPMVLRGLLPWTSRLEVTIAPQPPPPAASRKPPTRPSGATIFGLAFGVAVHDAAVEQVEAERGQIGEDDRLGGLGVDFGSGHRRRARRRSRPG